MENLTLAGAQLAGKADLASDLDRAGDGALHLHVEAAYLGGLLIDGVGHDQRQVRTRGHLEVLREARDSAIHIAGWTRLWPPSGLAGRRLHVAREG